MGPSFALYFLKRKLVPVLCALAMLLACGRWPPLRTYQVNNTADPDTSFQGVEEVVKANNYQIVERNDAARTLKLRTHVDEDSASRVSFITIAVNETGHVSLTPSGYLVRENGTIHQRLDDELANLEDQISGRLAQGAEAPVGTAAAPVSAAPEVAAGAPPGTPAAWVEPSSDPAKWGPGNFTCLPVNIPTADQSLIGLRLANGELAQVTLSLAYDAALCRSAAACPHAGGCPALGIGDEAQVQALAARLAAQEISGTATLLHRGQPAVIIDLNQHGSVRQAMSGAPAAPAQ